MSIGVGIRAPGRIYLLADGRISGFGYDSGYDVETDSAEKIIVCGRKNMAVLSTGEDDRNCEAFEALARKAASPRALATAYRAALDGDCFKRKRGLDVVVADGLHGLYRIASPEYAERKRLFLRQPKALAEELEVETTICQTDKDGRTYRTVISVGEKLLDALPFPPGSSISISSPPEIVGYLAELGRLAEAESDRRYPPFGPIGGEFKIGFVDSSGVKLLPVQAALEYARGLQG